MPSDRTCSLSLVRCGILQSSKQVVGTRRHRALAECSLTRQRLPQAFSPVLLNVYCLQLRPLAESRWAGEDR